MYVQRLVVELCEVKQESSAHAIGRLYVVYRTEKQATALRRFLGKNKCV